MAALPKTVLSARDAALLLMGFAGGFQPSELAALWVEDVEVTEEPEDPERKGEGAQG